MDKYQIFHSVPYKILLGFVLELEETIIKRNITQNYNQSYGYYQSSESDSFTCTE